MEAGAAVALEILGAAAEFLGNLQSAAAAGYDLAIEAQGVAKSLSSVINLMQSALPEDFMQQVALLQVEAEKRKKAHAKLQSDWEAHKKTDPRSRIDYPMDALGNLGESSGNRLADMARGMLDIMLDAKELLEALRDEFEELLDAYGDGKFGTCSILLCGCSKISRMQKVSGLTPGVEGKLKQLERMVQIMQAAINAAGLNVQMEQLERAFNSAAIFQDKEAKKFWGKCIGNNMSRVKFSEFQEHFFNYFKEDDRYHSNPNVKKLCDGVSKLHPRKNGDSVVLLQRLLQRYLDDSSADNFISTVEFNDKIQVECELLQRRRENLKREEENKPGVALGVSYLDLDVLASSSKVDCEPEFCKLNCISGGGGWMPLRNDGTQWIQVDLGSPKEVYSIAVQGCAFFPSSFPRYVRISYRLSMSEDQFVDIGQVPFPTHCEDSNDIKEIKFPSSVTARYFRIFPLLTLDGAKEAADEATNVGLRFELYGKPISSVQLAARFNSGAGVEPSSSSAPLPAEVDEKKKKSKQSKQRIKYHEDSMTQMLYRIVKEEKEILSSVRFIRIGEMSDMKIASFLFSNGGAVEWTSAPLIFGALFLWMTTTIIETFRESPTGNSDEFSEFLFRWLGKEKLKICSKKEEKSAKEFFERVKRFATKYDITKDRILKIYELAAYAKRSPSCEKTWINFFLGGDQFDEEILTDEQEALRGFMEWLLSVRVTGSQEIHQKGAWMHIVPELFEISPFAPDFPLPLRVLLTKFPGFRHPFFVHGFQPHVCVSTIMTMVVPGNRNIFNVHDRVVIRNMFGETFASFTIDPERHVYSTEHSSLLMMNLPFLIEEKGVYFAELEFHEYDPLIDTILSKSSYVFQRDSKVIANPDMLLENALVIRNFGLLKKSDPQTLQLQMVLNMKMRKIESEGDQILKNLSNSLLFSIPSAIRTSLIHRTIRIRVSLQHPALTDHQALGLWISPGANQDPKLFARPLFFGGLLDGSGFANLELNLRETPYGLELYHPGSDWVAVIPPMRRRRLDQGESEPIQLDDIDKGISSAMWDDTATDAENVHEEQEEDEEDEEEISEESDDDDDEGPTKDGYWTAHDYEAYEMIISDDLMKRYGRPRPLKTPSTSLSEFRFSQPYSGVILFTLFPIDEAVRINASMQEIDKKYNHDSRQFFIHSHESYSLNNLDDDIISLYDISILSVSALYERFSLSSGQISLKLHHSLPKDVFEALSRDNEGSYNEWMFDVTESSENSEYSEEEFDYYSFRKFLQLLSRKRTMSLDRSGRRRFSPDQFNTFLDDLRDAEKLQNLCFDRVSLRESEVAKLASAIKSLSRSLKIVKLETCDLEAADIKSLCSACKHCTLLLKLSFSGNELSEESFNEICEFVRKSNSLKSLDVSNCELSEKQQAKLLSILEERKNVIECFCYANEDSIDEIQREVHNLLSQRIGEGCEFNSDDEILQTSEHASDDEHLDFFETSSSSSSSSWSSLDDLADVPASAALSLKVSEIESSGVWSVSDEEISRDLCHETAKKSFMRSISPYLKQVKYISKSMEGDSATSYQILVDIITRISSKSNSVLRKCTIDAPISGYDFSSWAWISFPSALHIQLNGCAVSEEDLDDILAESYDHRISIFNPNPILSAAKLESFLNDEAHPSEISMDLNEEQRESNDDDEESEDEEEGEDEDEDEDDNEEEEEEEDLDEMVESFNQVFGQELGISADIPALGIDELLHDVNNLEG